jgi:hypothetical protein
MKANGRNILVDKKKSGGWVSEHINLCCELRQAI